jgi:type VI protein secretion system component VasF
MPLHYPFLEVFTWASPVSTGLLFVVLAAAVLYVGAGLAITAGLNSTLAALHNPDTPAR